MNAGFGKHGVDFDAELAGFSEQKFAAADGSTFSLFGMKSGHKEQLFIINAPATSAVFAARLARYLASRFDVVIMQSRGFNVDETEFFSRSNAFEDFYQDFLLAVRSGGFECAHFVAICSGAPLLLEAMAKDVITPAKIVLVTPSLPCAGDYPLSLAQESILPYIKKIVEDDDDATAEALIRLVNATLPKSDSSSAINIARNVVRMPFASRASLRVYADIMHTFLYRDITRTIAAVDKDVTIVGSTDDHTISIAALRKQSLLFKRSTLIEYPVGEHYAVFAEEAFHREIGGAL